METIVDADVFGTDLKPEVEEISKNMESLTATLLAFINDKSKVGEYGACTRALLESAEDFITEASEIKIRYIER